MTYSTLISAARYVAVIVLVAVVSAPAVRAQLEAEVVFRNLGFERPIDFEADGAGRLYVVQQYGKIFTFPNEPEVEEASLFLDISDRVLGNEDLAEAGLLGLAFHPNYEQNGYFYVYYTADEPFRSVIARFERSAGDPTQADPASEEVFLTVPQPDEVHQAGDLAFGTDGYLYIAVGDGGYIENRVQEAYSQDLTNLYGSILRIDIDGTSAGEPYAIPDTNPFAGNDEGYREEIYVYGLRNPWRFSIDENTGALWVGDVGEATWEEVNYIPKGGNGGWPVMEGPDCYLVEECDSSGFVEPIFAYQHGDLGRSVTGGFVYQGEAIPALRGAYVFGDWGGRNLWALERLGGEWIASEPYYTDRFISTFGEDEDGELYFMSFFHGGKIYQITDYTSLSVAPPVPGDGVTRLDLAGPNPFHQATSLTLQLGKGGHAQVHVYDAVGRRVMTLFDGFVPSGIEKTVDIEAQELSAGVYFARLTVDDGTVRTHPVVLAR